jgi:hypothetical protein
VPQHEVHVRKQRRLAAQQAQRAAEAKAAEAKEKS